RVGGGVEQPRHRALVLDGGRPGAAPLGADPEGEDERPDLQLVTVPGADLAVDRLAVEEGAVAAAEVADAHLPRPRRAGPVAHAGALAVGPEVTLRVPPDQEDGFGQGDLLVLLLALADRQLDFHRASSSRKPVGGPRPARLHGGQRPVAPGPLGVRRAG